MTSKHKVPLNQRHWKHPKETESHLMNNNHRISITRHEPKKHNNPPTNYMDIETISNELTYKASHKKSKKALFNKQRSHTQDSFIDNKVKQKTRTRAMSDIPSNKRSQF